MFADYTLFYNFNDTTDLSYLAMKLDIVIENQEEIKAMLQGLVAVSRDDISDDVLPQKIKNEHELRQLEIKLKDSSYRKKLVITVNLF